MTDDLQIAFTLPSGDQVDAIPFKIAKRSKLVADILADYDDDEQTVPIDVKNQDNEPEPSIAMMNLVLKYLKKYENEEPTQIEKPLKDGDLMAQLTEWEKNFILDDLLEDKDAWKHQQLVEVMYIASSLNIEPLISLTTSWIAQEVSKICRTVKGSLKAAAEIRKFLNIPGNGGWTTEQEKALAIEAEWPEDEE